MADQPLPNEQLLQVFTGRNVALELIDETGSPEIMEVLIVPDAYADLAKGYLGEGTPLARAILEKTAGQTVEYHMGDIQAVRILAVSEAQMGPDESIAERREQTMRAARDQSDLTSVMLFASSFNGKWGDYDPSSLSKEMDEKQKDADSPE
jgi:hypothetical protein